MKLSDFDYELPKELIAKYPVSKRDDSRMLVLEKKSGKITHNLFKDLPTYVTSDDILVLNDTKVINARLLARRLTGGKIEIFLLERLGENRFIVLIRPSGRIKEKEEIRFENSPLRAKLLLKKPAENVVEFFSPEGNIYGELKRLGNIPLPPYIKRQTGPLDDERYQTIYARREGATAAPTAGLHFTKEILENIASKGVELVYITLHVSYGTFAPVRVENIAEHKMHSESFELSEDSAAKINRVKVNGGRIFSTGTTSCRVLETCARAVRGSRCAVCGYGVEARRGRTDLYIYPPYEFKMTDALLTNFHLPKSTLLMLVCAFAGRELVFKAYREAIAEKYRFFSYGDCILIL